MHKTTKGLVLREVKYKEADKILTVLSQDEGKLTVKARGALRRSSRITAATQQLVFSEMTLFQNAGKWQLNEATTIEQFLPLRTDLSKMALGCYFAELLEAVSDEDSPNPAVLQLGLNSLYALSEDLCTPEQVKAVFEMRLMCLSGFEPVLTGCVACGEVHEDIRFSVRGGVLHCPGCPPGEPGQSLPLCEGSLAALRHIASAPAKKIFSFRLEETALRRLCDVTEAFVQMQLERGFGALDYWKTVR